ncbi:hypothetical protein [Blastococcus brunescens]|uniref:Uncharacterized protein n=1 Tax=Blastococcus brunescens TaxID=1564165 RepID=A0ABZ1B767_9ACTN|nr:hypothetical protein [Blastococcus sp. BMG 8361]WRL66658.1 hypothetical protein U6N30_15465 [Blastococcus sp. BMG 8361]
MHLLLEYTLAEDYLERRTALREDHLALARAAHERGNCCSPARCPTPTTGPCWSGPPPARSSRTSSPATPTSSTGWSPDGRSGRGTSSSADGHSP